MLPVVKEGLVGDLKVCPLLCNYFVCVGACVCVNTITIVPFVIKSSLHRLVIAMYVNYRKSEKV